MIIEKKIQQFVPIATFCLVNFVSYVSMASFSLRPNHIARIAPVFLVVTIAPLVGGLLLPLSIVALKRTRRTSFTLHSILCHLPIMAYLLTSVFFLTTDFDVWLHNEPLRHAFNFSLGLQITSSFYLFHLLINPRRRGIWLGIGTSLGFFTWRFLLFLAEYWPDNIADVNHPFLAIVFHLQFWATLLLIAVLIYGYLHELPIYFRQPRADPLPCGDAHHLKKTGNNGLRLLLASLFLAAMITLIDIRVLPQISLISGPAFDLILVLVVVSCPIVGWLLDNNNASALRRFVLCCSFFFILTPSLSLISHEGAYCTYVAVRSLAVMAQYIIYIGFSFAFAILCMGRRDFALAIVIPFTMRLFPISSFAFVQPQLIGVQGIISLFATMAAFLFYVVMRDVGLPEEVPDTGEPSSTPEEENGDETDAVNREEEEKDIGDSLTMAIERFLATRNLTPREREVAAMVIRGASTRDIAYTLDISEHTVKTHVKKMLEKFELPNRKTFVAGFISSK